MGDNYTAGAKSLAAAFGNTDYKSPADSAATEEDARKRKADEDKKADDKAKADTSAQAGTSGAGVFSDIMKVSQAVGGAVVNGAGGVYDTIMNKDKKAK